MIRSTLLAACAALVLAATSVAVPARADELAAAIELVHREYLGGLESGNSAALAELFTDDATQLPANGIPVRGRAAIKASYDRTFQRVHIATGSLHTTELVRRGDIVYEMGDFAFDFSTDGRYSHSAGRYLMVWRKVAGIWKIDLNLGQQEPR